jgi:hypothetical protein
MKKSRDGDVGPGGGEPDLEVWVPLSVREARRARANLKDLWSYVWMSFASLVILAATLAIVAYRVSAQTCH